MASLFKRGPVYWAGYRMNGQKVNVSLGTRDERKARGALAALEAKLESGELEERAKRLSFADFFDLYGEMYRAAGGAECAASRAKSWRSDSPALENFFRYARAKGVSRIDRVDGKLAEGFVRYRLGEGVKTATANHDFRVVKAAFNWAVRTGRLRASPFAHVRQVKLPAREIHYLREGEASKLVQAVRGRWVERPVMLMLYAGVRLNEALHVRWCDVDFSANVLRIVNHDDFVTKSRQARSIPIGAELRTLLLAWRAPEGLVAPSETGTVMDEANLRHRLATIGKRLGLHVSPHVLRRTFASLLWGKGVPIERISVYLGHSSIAVTQRWYASLDVTGDDSDVSLLSFAPKVGFAVVEGGASKGEPASNDRLAVA